MKENQRVRVFRKEPALFKSGNFGLEKENLRIDDSGMLSKTDHPIDKDDPYWSQIVRDFAESQVEFVTGTHDTPTQALEELQMLQDYFLEKTGAQLWPFSMPCGTGKESDIQIAKFDQSTAEGKEAVTYREALAKRHGKKMQLISGIHYNFSFSDNLIHKLGMDKNQLYFHVARNLLRYQWLFTYLLGASPAVDRTYKSDVIKSLKGIENCCKCCVGAHSYYEDFATSLRMSRYGYHSNLQSDLDVSFNNLEGYVHSLVGGIKTDKLIKESEYYAPVRFKQPKGNSGSVVVDLLQRGVEYIELRMFDLNPYEAYGIEPSMLYFTHLMLIYALLNDSPDMDKEEMDNIFKNNQRVALFGRKEGKKIFWKGEYQSITEVGEIILNELLDLAVVLDEGRIDGNYTSSVTSRIESLWYKDMLISDRIVKELMEENMSYREMGLKYSSGKVALV